MNLSSYQFQYAFDKGLNLLQRTASSGQTRMIAASRSNRAINSELYSSLGLNPAQEASLNNAFIDENIFDQGGNQLKSVASSGLGWDYRSMLVNTATDRKNDDGAKIGQLNEYNLYAKTGKRSRKITEKTDASGNIVEINEVIYLGNLEYRNTWIGDNLTYDGEIVSENGESKTPEEAYVALRIRQGHKTVSEKRVYTFKDGSLVSEVASFFSLDNNIDSCELQLNSDGDLESYYASKPYGETAVSYGKVKLHPYKYSGQEKDQSGLYYYGYRSLLPQNFRWMSADPAGLRGSGLNWYAMVNGNPVSSSDMFGLGLFDILISIAAGFMAGASGYDGLTQNNDVQLRSVEVVSDVFGAKISQEIFRMPNRKQVEKPEKNGDQSAFMEFFEVKGRSTFPNAEFLFLNNSYYHAVMEEDFSHFENGRQAQLSENIVRTNCYAFVRGKMIHGMTISGRKKTHNEPGEFQNIITTPKNDKKLGKKARKKFKKGLKIDNWVKDPSNGAKGSMAGERVGIAYLSANDKGEIDIHWAMVVGNKKGVKALMNVPGNWPFYFKIPQSSTDTPNDPHFVENHTSYSTNNILIINMDEYNKNWKHKNYNEQANGREQFMSLAGGRTYNRIGTYISTTTDEDRNRRKDTYVGKDEL